MRVRLTISYDGTRFSGFQAQAGQRTVQGELQAALARLTRAPVLIHGSGRTDAGVHAQGQVCHFDTLARIPAVCYKRLLRLPCDLIVHSSREVTKDFHARFTACWKWYRYIVTDRRRPFPYQQRFMAVLPAPVDGAVMRGTARLLLGTHDFTSLSGPSLIENRVRTLMACRFRRQYAGWLVDVVGSGFLYRMVRILVGTLYEFGRRTRDPQEVLSILAARNRRLAGPTLPPHGLCLMRVGYCPWPGENMSRGKMKEEGGLR